MKEGRSMTQEDTEAARALTRALSTAGICR